MPDCFGAEVRNLLLLTGIFLSSAAWGQQAVCAKSSLVTLREEPSDKAKVTWKVAKNMPFLRQEIKGSWIKITDLDGAVHWGKGRDFRVDVRCVVVRVAVAKLRAEPSESAPTANIKTVDRYTPFRRMAEEGPWILVEDELGNKSWINETNVWKPLAVKAISF